VWRWSPTLIEPRGKVGQLCHLFCTYFRCI
jgi:hypothetical protein